MTFSPTSEIEIRGETYRVVSMPNSSSEPMINGTGRRAQIYQLENIDRKTKHALKVFKPDFRDGYTTHSFDYFQRILDTIPTFSWVRERIMLSRNEDAELLKSYTILENAVLMPWFEWLTLDQIRAQIKEGTFTTTKTHCELMARKMAQTLYELEHRGISHGDIANSNVLFDWNNGHIAIIDIEDMYHASQQNPNDGKYAGTNGYAFQMPFNAWIPEADRFVGAILITELLTLTNADCVRAARAESYFKQDDLDVRRDAEPNRQRDTLLEALSSVNPTLYDLLYQALEGEELSALPAFSEWVKALGPIMLTELPSVARNGSSAQKQPPTPQLVPEEVIPNVTQRRDTRIDPKPTKVPYARRATSDDPVWIILLLDLSRSMFRYRIGNRLRIDVACDLINNLLSTMAKGSMKGVAKTRPRYHISVIGYHKQTKHILTHDNTDVKRENNEEHAAKPANGIFSLPMLRDDTQAVVITPAMINKNIKAGEDVDEFPQGETHMTQALKFVDKLIEDNIATYNESHPPYILHITDGANTDDGDPEAVFRDITSRKTQYGNTLMATAYIGADLLENVPNLKIWSGVTDQTRFMGDRKAAAIGIRNITSRIPALYHKQITGPIPDNPGLRFAALSPSMYMMFPGSSPEMLSLALALSASTGTV